MNLDSGLLTIYSLENVAPAGFKPRQALQTVESAYYEERTIGVNRLYAARGANAAIDMLVRIWDTAAAQVNRYVIPEDGLLYRIDAVQTVTDDDGLRCRDLTLVRVEDNYDVDG